MIFLKIAFYISQSILQITCLTITECKDIEGLCGVSGSVVLHYRFESGKCMLDPSSASMHSQHKSNVSFCRIVSLISANSSWHLHIFLPIRQLKLLQRRELVIPRTAGSTFHLHKERSMLQRVVSFLRILCNWLSLFCETFFNLLSLLSCGLAATQYLWQLAFALKWKWSPVNARGGILMV